MSSNNLPPPGGDQNVGGRLFAVCLASMVVASMVVVARLYVRGRIVRQIGWDDWVMLFALILGLIATAAEIIGIYRGLGRHGYYLSPHDKGQAMKYSMLSQTFCIQSLNFCKISICIAILRILQGTRSLKSKWFLYTTMALVVVVNVLITITLWVQCRPTRKVWQPKVPGVCWAPTVQRDLTYLQGVVSALTDFSLSGFPILILQKLHLDKRKKLVLCFLMGAGTFTGVTAIIRTVHFGPYAKVADPTFTTSKIFIWTSLERNIAIIVASIPSMAPLINTFVQFRSRGASGYRDGMIVQNQSYGLSDFEKGIDSKSSVTPYVVSVERQGSEGSILPVHHPQGIWKTTQVKSEDCRA